MLPRSAFRSVLRLAVLLGLASSLSACIVLPPRHGGGYHHHHGYDGRGYGAPRGVGLVTGGVVGAVVGHELARDGGDPALGTAVGAVAGAVIGHQIERSQRRR